MRRRQPAVFGSHSITTSVALGHEGFMSKQQREESPTQSFPSCIEQVQGLTHASAVGWQQEKWDRDKKKNTRPA
ncbi:hypothetical protein HNQ77_002486 [Silvibacterium bohemicum]|uniref:Uncharacterized protein n=1 Tax=Silvibacterium bohemicum TaxID=1577686 RepID=A0A841K2Q0_9BACT|nr:hypothetical protein [Silvibacterium bohemicum]